jgi:chaperonin GroES
MAKVTIKPIGDRVLVEHIEEKEQVRGGIIIPDSAKEKPQEAKVIALGTGKKNDDGKVTPFEVKVGGVELLSKAVKVTLGPRAAMSSSTRNSAPRPSPRTA